MNTYILRIASLSLMLCLLAAGVASGHTNDRKQFPDFDIPDFDDLDDIDDLIDQFEDISYIIDNLPGFGLSMDQEDPITTSLDDAITDAPFLDIYPVSNFIGDRQFITLNEIPRAPDGSRMLMPGRYDHDLETFCLKSGTHGPGHGEGYLYAPLQGPSAEIIRDLLKNSETHPEFGQSDIQYLVWAIIARTKFSDLTNDQRNIARQLLSDSQISELNMGALGIIPQDQMGAVFEYINVPAGAERVMRSNADIRRLMIEEGTSYADIEAIAILTGDPPMSVDDVEIPAERWSYHPDGYFIRYYPRGYSQTRIEIAVPDQFTIEFGSDREIISIEDEHGNRLELNNGILTFSWRDVNDPWNTLHEEFGSFNVNVNSGWINGHRAEVIRLCDGSDWVDTIVKIGTFSHALDAHLGSGAFNGMDNRLDAMDLAKEAWMYAVIRANMTKDTILASKELDDYDWRDRWRPYDPSDDVANPGRRAHQRIGGRDPRPSQDPDFGDNPQIPEFKPNQHPEASNTMDTVDKFGNLTDKMAWLESGSRMHAANTIGFAIPSYIFGEGLKWVVSMWQYCTGQLSIDPPRFDYDQVAEPRSFDYYFLESPADGPADMVDAQNAMLTAFLDVSVLLEAALTSMERHSGASIDGDDYWSWEQAKACVYYRRQAGYAMYPAADRIDEYLALLRADGVTDIYVTREDYTDAQEQLAIHGYSPESMEAARTIGMPEPMIQAFLNREIANNPYEMSGSVMEAAEELSAALRVYGNYLINLPDAYPESEVQGYTLGISP